MPTTAKDLKPLLRQIKNPPIVWTERGGPTVPKAQAARGYGTQLMQRSVTEQLRGLINYDRAAEGVIVTLCLDEERVGV